MLEKANGGNDEGGRDTYFLDLCIQLARRAGGATSPNPMVGALVVRDGEVVGSAWHHRAGEPHAERLALQQAGEAARGATLYSNMEPCCHHGRTPPCTEAIVNAGVTRVVASIRDPDERVDGKGFSTLIEAGVEVLSGLQEEEATELNDAYLKVRRCGIPFVIAKAALSLDGRLATRTGSSQWITGEQARVMAHHLRAASDAVMVGVGTVIADDPRLTARHGGGAGPRYRVVLDSHLRTPPGARVLQGEQGSCLVLTTTTAPSAARARLQEAGAEVLEIESNDSGRVCLHAALRKLAQRHVSTLMIEGGSEVLTGAFELDIIDKVFLFFAPVLIGGEEALPLWGGQGAVDMAAARRLRRIRHHQLGRDWAVEAYLRAGSGPESSGS